MKADRNSQHVSRRGGALLSIVIGLILVSMMGATMAGLIYRSGHGHAQAYDIVRARYLAESGISYARIPGKLKSLADGGKAVTVALAAQEQFTVVVTRSNDLYNVESIGATGIGSGRETRQRITRGKLRELDWNPDKSPPEVGVSTVAPVEDDLEGGTLANWRVTKAVDSLAGFERTEFSGGDGVIRTDMSASTFMMEDPRDPSHYIGHQALYFDRRATLGAAWQTNSYQISYETQVKMLWERYRRYGAQGLVVLLKNDDNDLSKGKIQGYYVSLMRYHSDSEEGDYSDTISYDYDGIPNTIKPPGLAEHRLLVVWKQYSQGQKWDWIAYKDLDHYSGLPGEDTVDWAVDWNDDHSGQGFKDYATIAVRVIEAQSPTKKYRYLQVLRADPKTGVTRAANKVGEDVNANRMAYLPQRQGGTFPQWSPLDYNRWSTTDDYFTLLATLSDDPLEQITWDGVNTNGQSAIVILPDHGTIRTEDLVTLNSGDWNSKRYEIGLHATGNFNNALNNVMYFDEFAVRFFINKPFGQGVSGVQY